MKIEWVDCQKLLPYRDFEGRWRAPWRTQFRRVIRDGVAATEYRERKETADEFFERQF